MIKVPAGLPPAETLRNPNKGGPRRRIFNSRCEQLGVSAVHLCSDQPGRVCFISLAAKILHISTN